MQRLLHGRTVLNQKGGPEWLFACVAQNVIGQQWGDGHLDFALEVRWLENKWKTHGKTNGGGK